MLQLLRRLPPSLRSVSRSRSTRLTFDRELNTRRKLRSFTSHTRSFPATSIFFSKLSGAIKYSSSQTLKVTVSGVF